MTNETTASRPNNLHVLAPSALQWPLNEQQVIIDKANDLLSQLGTAAIYLPLDSGKCLYMGDLEGVLSLIPKPTELSLVAGLPNVPASKPELPNAWLGLNADTSVKISDAEIVFDTLTCYMPSEQFVNDMEESGGGDWVKGADVLALLRGLEASQPKSIGDDAQFRILADAMCWNYVENYVNGGSAEKAQQAQSARGNFIAYLDSKLHAPAVQASATIQAAPETCTGCDNPAGTQTAESHGFCKDCVEFPDSTPAATIQEPVMVAERTPNSSDPRDEAHAAGWNACLLAMRLAAPMVADPAGVALEPAKAVLEAAAEAIYNRLPMHQGHDAKSMPWQHGGNSIKQDEARRYASAALQAAATVKAVPSEELDWTEALEKAALTAEATDVAQWSDHAGWHDDGAQTRSDIADAIRALAAPLADKTGGGE